MGQSVSAIHDAAAERSVQDERTANDALNSLNTIAQDKLTLFKTYVEGGTNSREIPIEKVIASDSLIKCGVSSSDEGLKKAVTGMIESLTTGDFVAAISSAAGLALDALLGSYAGNIAEKQLYKVCVGRFGGIQRIDYYLYSYKYTSESLIKVTKNVVVTCMMVSSVDPKDVSSGTLRVVLQNNYPNEPIEKLQELYDMVMAEKRLMAGGGEVSMRTLKSLGHHGEENKEHHIEDEVTAFVSQAATAIGTPQVFSDSEEGAHKH